MADILTQLQDCLDQLSTQFTASLSYTLQHSPPTPHSTTSPPPSQNANPPTTAPPNINNQPPLTASPTLAPLNQTTPSPSSSTFTTTQHELSTDLLLKTAQIHSLTSHLPGLANSREKQEGRIRALEDELRAVESERKIAVGRRERALGGLEGVIAGARR